MKSKNSVMRPEKGSHAYARKAEPSHKGPQHMPEAKTPVMKGGSEKCEGPY